MAIPPENRPATLPGPPLLDEGQQVGSADQRTAASIANADNAEVAMPCNAYLHMRETYWALIQDLLGGTPAMRAARSKWLPKNDREQDEDYNERLGRTFLYGAYEDTVDDIVGRPFSHALQYEGWEGLPDALTGIDVNADGNGTDLSELAKDLFVDGINYGKFHVLVDMPTTPAANLAEERRLGIRPRLVRIDPLDLIGWQYVVEDGIEVLTQIRVKETISRPSGKFSSEDVERVRVYGRDAWEVYECRKTNRGAKWVLTASGKNRLGVVPLVTGYFKRAGFLTSVPPLKDLAFANLEHWQSSSEQRHILHYSRVPFLFGSGFTSKELQGRIEVGAQRMVRSTNPDAKMGYVEIHGKSLESGATDLERIEERMEVLGLQPLIKASVEATATKTVVDEKRKEATIHDWIRATEKGLMQALRFAARWMKSEIPSTVKASIYRDFTLGRADSDMRDLQQMRDRGDISQKRILLEAKRRGILDDDVNIDDEMSSAKLPPTKSPAREAPAAPPQREAEGEEE